MGHVQQKVDAHTAQIVDAVRRENKMAAADRVRRGRIVRTERGTMTREAKEKAKAKGRGEEVTLQRLDAAMKIYIGNVDENYRVSMKEMWTEMTRNVNEYTKR